MLSNCRPIKYIKRPRPYAVVGCLGGTGSVASVICRLALFSVQFHDGELVACYFVLPKSVNLTSISGLTARIMVLVYSTFYGLFEELFSFSSGIVDYSSCTKY